MPMDPERWQQIERIFIVAAELTGPALDEYLEKACGSDAALRREVLALIDADADAGTIDDSGLPKEQSALLAEGERVGAFTIREEIGAGGMGVVYRAERDDDQIQQTVAIKIIRAALFAPQLQRRFLAERQILARLDHPGIARLVDAGTTSAGLPYVAMEYVPGRPLHEHCDDSRLSLRERLRLFAKVCEAVEYAHRNLIVHRDLKPSNVLVTPEGQPKLLDFGIAKLLEEGAEDITMAQTGDGGGQLTPAYASPEHLRGESVTTATDVYSLGVVLSELLAAGRPYKVPSVSRSAWERAITDTAPVRPSQLVGKSSDAETLAQQRATTPANLERDLRGDLDALVEKATRREPEQRYAGPGEFAADVQRYLDGFPVHARRGSRRYRLAKFARRNAVAVGAAAAVLVLTVAFLITLAVYSVRLTEERDRANQQAGEAAAVSGLLIELLERASPEVTGRNDVTVREALELGSDLILKAQDNNPATQLRLCSTLALCYGHLGEFDRGMEVVDVGLERWAPRLAVDHPATLLLRFRRADLLHKSGQNQTAVEAYSNVLELWDEDLVVDDVDRADLQIGLSGVHERLWEFDEGERLAKEAVQFREQRFGLLAPETADAVLQLSSIITENGQPIEAEALLREACAVYRASPDHQDRLAGCLQSLTMTMIHQGRADEAIEIVDEGLAADKSLYGDEHPYYAKSLHHAAVTYGSLGDFDLAEQMCRRALELRKQLLGIEHELTWSTMQILAQIQVRRGEHDEARELLQEVRRQQEASPEISPEQVTNTLSFIGQIEYLSANYPKAAKTLEEAAASMRDLGFDTGRDYIQTLHDLARTYNVLNRYAEAEGVLAEMLRLAEDQMEEDAHTRVVGRGELGWAIARQGRVEQGEALLSSALDHWRRVAGEGRDTNRMQERLNTIRRGRR